jgi:tRNA(Arg) A34 adenosine deaminase TadA
MNIDSYIKLAAFTAESKKDRRTFRIGAVAVRNDGTVVRACNGPSIIPCSSAHAEVRLSRKLDKGAVVFVARIRSNGMFGMAKPCYMCECILKSKGVRTVYYTDSDNNILRLDY